MNKENLSENLFFWCFLLPPYHIPEIIPKEKCYFDFIKPVISKNNWHVSITITDDLFLKFDVLSLHEDIEKYLEKDLLETRIDGWRFDITSICIDYINVLQLFISSEYISNRHFWVFKINEITRNKLIWCRVNPSEYENIDLNCDPYTNILSDARHWFLYRNKFSCQRISYEFNKYYNVNYISSAIDKYLKVIENSKIRNCLSHFTNCLFEYYKWNFWESFVLTRFYIESYYKKLWERENKKTSKRVPIHGILEDLKNKWIINKPIYRNLILLKNHRNKLAHNFQQTKIRNRTPQEITYRCLITCLTLINREFKLNILFDPNVNLLNYMTSIPK